MQYNILDEDDKSSVGYRLSEILKKYGLEEEEEKGFEKLEKDEPLNGEVVSEICSNLAKNLILETDATLSIQKKLNITEGVAKEIINDIKNVILAQLKGFIAKRYNLSANKNAPDTTVERIEKKLLAEVKPTMAEEPISSKNIKTPVKRVKKYTKNLEISEEDSKFPKTIIEKEMPKQGGPDRYREPVE